MKLRTRISLITAILTIIPVFILGAANYQSVTRSIESNVDELLINSTEVRNLNRFFRKSPFDQLPEDAVAQLAIGVMTFNEQITVLREAGTREESLPFPELTAEQIRAADRKLITLEGEYPYRVITASDRFGNFLILAASLRESRGILEELIIRFTFAALAIAAISGLLAWLIIGRLFKPIEDMAEKAKEIAAGKFYENMPEVKSGTEISELTSSINTMLFSIKRFISDASHELRTPLTVIRGYSEILQKPESDKTQIARAAERIENESKRMESLVNDLLALAKIDVKGEYSKNKINYHSLLKEYFTDIKFQDESREVIFDLAGTSEIISNEELLRQIFSNLTQNILRHTPPGSKVQIVTKQEKDYVLLGIDDSGPGITPENRAKVFERFGRLDQSRSRQTGGAGLGMSIVLAIIQKLSGEIFLRESVFGGLGITIKLPTA